MFIVSAYIVAKGTITVKGADSDAYDIVPRKEI